MKKKVSTAVYLEIHRQNWLERNDGPICGIDLGQDNAAFERKYDGTLTKRQQKLCAETLTGKFSVNKLCQKKNKNNIDNNTRY